AVSSLDAETIQMTTRLQYHYIPEWYVGEGFLYLVFPVFKEAEGCNYQNGFLRAPCKPLPLQVLPYCNQRHVGLTEPHVICQQGALQSIKVGRVLLQSRPYHPQHPLDALTLMGKRLASICSPIRLYLRTC